MICKHCRPIFRENNSDAFLDLILEHIELCPLHAGLQEAYQAEASSELETAKERRRYALLLAAAMLHETSLKIAETFGVPPQPVREDIAKAAVEIAEALLAEIEKRENPEERS